jgi:protocatechuate 3,4-dioxygenase beta subunit
MNNRKLSKITRREVLRTLTVAVGGLLNACGGSPTSASSTSTTSTPSGGTTSAACVVTPTETAGPYPDITGMLNNPAFYRRDVTEGKPGLPLTLTLTIVNANSNCARVSGAVVEIWHCDAQGVYSEYGQGTGQTFLRGLQTADASGEVTFATIYPGWYAGRATHIHVDVYVGGRNVKTTQIAFPESVTAAVYATGVYATKGQNPQANASDSVFADGTSSELATLTGSAASGYTATLQISIAI